MKFPQSYTLSIDLFGPLSPKEQGRSEGSVSGIPHVKYGLVGAFRVPRSALPSRTSKVNQDGVSDLFGLGPSVSPQEELAEYEPSLPDLEPLDEFPELWDLDEDWHEGEEGVQEQLLSSVYAVAGDDESSTGARDRLVHNLSSDPNLLEGWDVDLPENKDELVKMIEELNHPTEQVVLRYFGELRSKSGTDVAEAVQNMILEINKYYPVRVVHCDLEQSSFQQSSRSGWQIIQFAYSTPCQLTSRLMD